MAAPAVTGVVALMRERHPEWTPAQIRAALIGSAVPRVRRLERDGRGLAAAHRRRLRRRARRRRARRARRSAGARLRPAAGPGRRSTVPVSVQRRRRRRRRRGRSRIDRHGGSPAGAERNRADRGRGPDGGRRAAAGDADRRARRAARATPRATCVLTQGTRTRRIPYWAHVERPRLAGATRAPASHPGNRARVTRGPARSRRALSLPRLHRGRSGCRCTGAAGEALYRFHLAKRAINVGVTVEPISGGGLRPFVMRGPRRESRRG